jgi:hypothetical protein
MAVTFTTHAHHLQYDLIAALAGSIHFVRVSMDGIGATYEAIRRRPFAALLRRLEDLANLAPFGINVVVNARTLPDLDAIARLAAEMGAIEILLLPEQPVRGTGGVDATTVLALRRWVAGYRGPVPLAVSECGADGLPTCNPVEGESGLCAYAHIDASGILKRSSYHVEGVPIGGEGVMAAMNVLRDRDREGGR